MGKYEHQVNDLQKHMRVVAWCNPNSSAPANHFARTGRGLPPGIPRVTTGSKWQWPFHTCQLAVGSAPVPSITCWGTWLCLGSQNRWHKPEHCFYPKFTSSHATPARTGEEHVAAMSRNQGVCAPLQFICHSKKSTIHGLYSSHCHLRALTLHLAWLSKDL